MINGCTILDIPLLNEDDEEDDVDFVPSPTSSAEESGDEDDAQ